jgi:hypothetical protein
MIRRYAVSMWPSEIPASVPAPPTFWVEPYAAMASSDELAWASLTEVTEAVSAFLDPVLSGAEGGFQVGAVSRCTAIT